MKATNETRPPWIPCVLAAIFSAFRPARPNSARNSAGPDAEIRIGNIMPYTGPLAAFAAIGRAEPPIST